MQKGAAISEIIDVTGRKKIKKNKVEKISRDCPVLSACVVLWCKESSFVLALYKGIDQWGFWGGMTVSTQCQAGANSGDLAHGKTRWVVLKKITGTPTPGEADWGGGADCEIPLHSYVAPANAAYPSICSAEASLRGKKKRSRRKKRNCYSA